MGFRGPPKKPTELKLLQGAPGGMSKLPKGEVKPEKLMDTEPPAMMTDDAKAVWTEMVPRLEKLGLFTELDVCTFQRYCELSARWLRASARIRETGQTHVPIFHEQSEEEIKAKVKPRLKYIQELPESVEFRQLPRELLRMEQHFGMTPAARASINILPAGKKSPDETKKFLYG